MKSERFLEALGEIDEKYIEEARYKVMKKKFNFKPIIAVAACAAFALAAIPVANHFAKAPDMQSADGTKIGANGNFSVYEGISYDESIDWVAVEHKTEFVINPSGKDFNDSRKLNETKKIQIDGKTFVGKYKNSTSSDYYRDDRDNYEAIENGRKVQFSLNRETGKCTLFFLSKISDEKIENKFTRDECFDIAIEHLSQYVDDIENYELKYEYERMGGFGYFFMLYRTVNGIMTSDRITVGVRENGEIYAHTLHSIGTMKNADVSELSMKGAETALSEKINLVYKNTFDISYTVDSAVLSKLKNGSYVLDYTAIIKASNIKGGNKITEAYQFIVAVD